MKFVLFVERNEEERDPTDRHEYLMEADSFEAAQETALDMLTKHFWTVEPGVICDVDQRSDWTIGKHIKGYDHVTAQKIVEAADNEYLVTILDMQNKSA